MRPLEQWIWIPANQFPERQTCNYNCMTQNIPEVFTVAAFKKSYLFKKQISELKLRICGDTVYRLRIGEEYEIYGPAAVGGDFLYTERQPTSYYAYSLTLLSSDGLIKDLFRKGELPFYAEVRMTAERMCEASRGHGGFMLTGSVRFEDGTKTFFFTDDSWQTKILFAYKKEGYDGRMPEGDFIPASIIPNIWHCEEAQIPPVKVYPSGFSRTVSVPAFHTVKEELELDMIWSGFVRISCRCEGETYVVVTGFEKEDECSCDKALFIHDGRYQGFALQSIGRAEIEIENRSSKDSFVTVEFCICHYPCSVEAYTAVSDKEMNRVLALCRHNLRICRQSMHLDSPRHCEPLACTGDYYIESLMTAMTFGDMRLAAFDVRRTAEMLRYRDGRMFHTTYSLIWVQMLWDVYLFTGEKALLEDCEQALTVLLDRFSRYIGENGLIETPPDYMFIDWLSPDGINLHHPPKALGQTCLCLFYYHALKTACSVYSVLDEKVMAEMSRSASVRIGNAIRSQLWDEERQLFFEGLNTPTPESCIGQWQPANITKKYYRRHANILAAYTGLLSKSESQALLRRIWEDDSLGEVQPYFMHFWMEAVYRNGLREEYTLPLLNFWKPSVLEFGKGLVEGFYKPVPSYRFDHSHAWAGTPAYALPLALSGLEIKDAGFRRISLDPSLLGLEKARVEIPTPYGILLISMDPNGVRTEIPEEIECELKSSEKNMT